ncbi:MAG: hypothetical protein J6P21_00385 [Clostridia bacterium]|nr:hypothetical protein [Clostridia bacterium]
MSLYHNILGKKQKKPDEQEPGKKNKKPNSQEENGSESTEEQKANLGGFLRKFDGVAQWVRGEQKSGLVNLGSDSQEVSELKKVLETIFLMVVNGKYKACDNLSADKQKVSSMILEWIKGERDLDIEEICVEDAGNGLAIDIFFKPVSKRVRVEVWVGYSEGCIDHITFSCGSNSDLIEIFPNNAKS